LIIYMLGFAHQLARGRIMSSMRRLVLRSILLISAMSFAPTVLARPASFTGVGKISSDTLWTSATAVSADGSVVVGESESTYGGQAFRWNAGQGISSLIGLADPNQALGISGDGSAVVGYGIVNRQTGAFHWRGPFDAISLGRFSGGDSSLASGASADGLVVVGAANHAPRSSSYEAFRWTSENGLVGLGDLPGGDVESHALAVSANGSVVAGFSKSANGIEAFRWTAGSGMAGMEDLSGSGFYSYARAISADGRVIVGNSTSANGMEAF